MPVYEEKNKKRWTKDGYKYYYRCYYTNSYGKLARKKSKMYKGRLEAKRAEEDFLMRVATRDEIDYDIMFETVYNEWIIIKRRSLKSTTAYSLSVKLNKNILEFFRNYKLHNIKINTILQYYQWLKNKSFSIEYENMVISYLKDILSYAKENYEFDKKVVSSIQRSKVEVVKDAIPDSQINCWTYNEFLTFINSVDNNTYYTLFYFLFFTGLRKGELFALTWNDVDFENKSVSISKTISAKVGTGTYQITTPKTQNSIRIIDLDDKTYDLLMKHYESESKIYGFNKSMFIFGNIKPISATSLDRKLNEYISLSKVKKSLRTVLDTLI